MENERPHIGYAWTPKSGQILISEIHQQFPHAPFVNVIDTDGVKYQGINRKCIQIFKPTSNESENPTV